MTRSLAPFLPQHLVRELHRRRLAAAPSCTRREAALLFSDISGFTALTEKLQARGREGAEEVSLLVSAAFRPAMGAIGRYGGSIVSFGGDALFTVFFGASPVRRAVAAAERIRAAFARRPEVATSAGPARLGISQAIHFGVVRDTHLGSDAWRVHVVQGPAVAALAALEARARPGEVLLSPAAEAGARTERAPRPVPRRKGGSTAPAVASYLPPELRTILSGYEGTYRQAAVLFLESRGGALAALQAAVRALQEALVRFGGLLLKTDLSPAGLKWVCVFGIPTAHEDDAVRAARAALDVVARTPRGFAWRGGLHSGTVANVVVGSSGRRSFDVMGDVVNTAARALSRAAWGEVVATGELCRAHREIEVEDRGKHAVKGKAEPLHLFALRMVAAGQRPLRLDAPLVGRASEMEDLDTALRRAAQGRGQAIGVVGDAGIGKSRLKWEIQQRAEQAGFAVHEGRASSFGAGAYWVVAELLREALSIAPGLGPRDVLLRTFDVARQLGLPDTDQHHLADLLGVRHEESPLRHLDARAIHLNNMIAARACLLALARRRPRLFVLEDMHLADRASREVAGFAAAELRSAPALMLLLARPGEPLPPGVREIALRELSSDAVASLLEALLGHAPAVVRDLVSRRAEGNPFYVEELVRHLVESGLLVRAVAGYQLARPVGPHDLPGTLESLIVARLDRLPAPARRVAQVGSVVGRSFAHDLLVRLPEAQPHPGASLRELGQRDVLVPRVEANRREHSFRHALTRDVTYGTILVARRRALHRDVAEAMEALGLEEAGASLGILGHHWEQGSEPERARPCYLAAAQRAAAVFAHQEAEAFYRAYLALSPQPTRERTRARRDLAEVLRIAGRVAPALEEQSRAVEEARVLGEDDLEASCLRHLGTLHRQAGRGADAAAAYGRALEIYRARGDRGGVAATLGSLALLANDQGRLDDARQGLAEAEALQLAAGDDAGRGVTLGHLAGVLHELSRTAEAVAVFDEAIAALRRARDRRGEGIVLGNVATIHQYQGDLGRAADLHEQALAIHRETGDRRAMGITLGNLAMLAQQQHHAGTADLYRQALTIHREVGNRRSEGIALMNLCELHRDRDDLETARDLGEAATVIAREIGDRRVEGVALYNLAGVLFDLGKAAEAVALARRACAILEKAGDRRFLASAWEGLGSFITGSGSDGEAREALQRALALHGEAGNRAGAVSALLHASALERQAGRLAVAKEHVAAARASLAGLREPQLRILVACEEGHLTIAQGGSPEEALREAREALASLPAAAETRAARSIRRLEEAAG